MTTYNTTVRVTDTLGLDAHFMRLLILAIFEERDGMSHHIPKICLWKDALMIFVIIIPLFIVGLRFWTSPSYLKYSLRINAMVAPLALLPTFFAYHGDVKTLGFLVLIMNVYVFWYHAEPPYEYNYHSSRRTRTSSDDSDEHEDLPRGQNAERFYTGV